MKKVLIILILLSALLVATAESELNAEEKQEILGAQNRYRSEVNVMALNWSENLSEQAQQCADYSSALNYLYLLSAYYLSCLTPSKSILNII